MTDTPQDPPVQVEVEVVDGAPPEGMPEGAVDGSKLMRIASMTRAMLDEARHAPVDEAGRKRLREIYDLSIEELNSVLPDELREELEDVFLPIEEKVPSESEIRIAQAQLVGWLEGLFNGIQAALVSQQLAARAQLQQLRNRPELEASAQGDDEDFPGVYL